MNVEMLWSLGLSAVLGLVSWVLKNHADEVQRLQILLNRTREELAKDYVTRADVHNDMNRVITRIDNLDTKIDRILQLTGKDNYRAFASDMRVPDVMENPSLVETDYAMETAMWFFEKNGLFAIADKGVSDDIIKQITKRVNGGYIGLDHRKKETEKIYGWLKA